jgi:hypothetical protein
MKISYVSPVFLAGILAGKTPPMYVRSIKKQSALHALFTHTIGTPNDLITVRDAEDRKT